MEGLVQLGEVFFEGARKLNELRGGFQQIIQRLQRELENKNDNLAKMEEIYHNTKKHLDELIVENSELRFANSQLEKKIANETLLKQDHVKSLELTSKIERLDSQLLLLQEETNNCKRMIKLPANSVDILENNEPPKCPEKRKAFYRSVIASIRSHDKNHLLKRKRSLQATGLKKILMEMRVDLIDIESLIEIDFFPDFEQFAARMANIITLICSYSQQCNSMLGTGKKLVVDIQNALVQGRRNYENLTLVTTSERGSHVEVVATKRQSVQCDTLLATAMNKKRASRDVKQGGPSHSVVTPFDRMFRHANKRGVGQCDAIAATTTEKNKQNKNKRMKTGVKGSGKT